MIFLLKLKFTIETVSPLPGASFSIQNEKGYREAHGKTKAKLGKTKFEDHARINKKKFGSKMKS